MLFTMPMAASSAIRPLMTSALVSPGMTTMSMPTEQTAVMASSFSSVRLPQLAALIMPSSSDTGMNAPDRPPTWLDAMTPPFLTASFSRARQAVVPQQPQLSRPISSRMFATLSPIAGVGASDRSMMPAGTPRRSLARFATSWPRRVILNAVRLTSSATSSIGASFGSLASAARTAPGPETPTWISQSGSPAPWNAPAMNGLSSGALQNTTSFASPMHMLSFVSSAVSRTTSPISLTASMLMPDFVEPILTLEQTISVSASARGMAAISRLSPAEKPLCTSAPKPPMKLTPTALAARSSVLAYCTGSASGAAPSNIAMGVTLMRLLTMGMPYSALMPSTTETKLPARRVILL